MTQHRGGDASIIIDGETKTLRLTLGALAALEENLGQGDFATLQKKLEAPRVADLLVILQALLQGGGAIFSLDALKASDIDLSDAASAIAKAFRALEPSPARGRGQGEGASSLANLSFDAPSPPAPLPQAGEGR
jgi:hypothetical protein